MKPHLICHMLSSVDGRIDGDSLDAVMSADDYEATAAKLGANAWMCGRATMQLHFAEEKPFVSSSHSPAGPQPVFAARQAESYVVSVDTFGKLRWASGDLDGEHLVCVVSERAPSDCLAFLREKAVSFIVAGESAVDLRQAMDLLGEHFGIRTLLLEGGGNLNGAFLQAGLVDEVSLLPVPGIEGRRGISAVFDGMSLPHNAAVPLKLKSVEQRANDALWIRYDVARS